MPENNDIFSEIIKKTSAKIAHIINCEKTISLAEILKTCSGMLKYADNNFAGRIDLQKFALKLELSKEEIESCLEFLNNVEIIKIINKNSAEYTIKFLQSKDLSQIKRTKEYLILEEKLSSDNNCEIFLK